MANKSRKAAKLTSAAPTVAASVTPIEALHANDPMHCDYATYQWQTTPGAPRRLSQCFATIQNANHAISAIIQLLRGDESCKNLAQGCEDNYTYRPLTPSFRHGLWCAVRELNHSATLALESIGDGFEEIEGGMS